MCGFIAQLVEHRTGIAEVMGSNPVEALIFFRLLLSSCLNWKIYCDDHTSLTFYTVFNADKVTLRYVQVVVSGLKIYWHTTCRQIWLPFDAKRTKCECCHCRHRAHSNPCH